MCSFFCVYSCELVCVFFFKQKTAYEMRISDWSSDVCSSDLCSITRGPANPISAFGSAIWISPSCAKLADTPPIVGCVSTETNGSPRSPSLASAADVLAICISENNDSCMRAPPVALKQTYGSSEEHTSELQSLMRNSSAD